MRFNDMRVSEVKEEEVFTESVGGHANSSAYFLIYLEKSMLNQVSMCVCCVSDLFIILGSKYA